MCTIYLFLFFATTSVVEVLSQVQATDFLPNGLVKRCGKRDWNNDALTPGAHPWLVKLLYDSPKISRCGGVLIAEEWVLTSADCARSEHLSAIMLGKYDTSDDWDCLRIEFEDIPQRVLITNKIIDEEFNVALLNLNNRVNTNEYVQPICLPFRTTLPDMVGDVGGWSYLDSDMALYNSELTMTNMTVIPSEECTDILNVTIHSHQFCAEVWTPQESCAVMPGGPLIQYWTLREVGHYFVGGIMVQEDSYCNTTKPLIFVDIITVHDWIVGILQTATLGGVETGISYPGGREAFTKFESNGLVKDCGIRLAHNENYTGEFPWLVKLLYNYPRITRCGGVLISDNWVLSSATCTRSNLLQAVMLGEYITTDFWDCLKIEPNDIAQRILIENKIIHRQIDVGLLRLRHSIKRSEYVIPICLPFEEDIIITDYSGRVSAWSNFDDEGHFYNDELKITEMTILDRQDCGIMLKTKVPPSKFCGRPSSILQKSCVVTPGGPFMESWERPVNRFYVSGIMLHESRPCDSTDPIVFLEVQKVARWIKKILGVTKQ